MLCFVVMCAGIGAVSGLLLESRGSVNAAPRAVGKAALVILLVFWTISLLTLPLGQALSAVLLSVLGVFAARGVLGRDRPEGKPEQVVFDGASAFRDLVPTPHLFVEGTDGSGLTTYLARIADTAGKEGRPVMAVLRNQGDQARLFSHIPAGEDYHLVVSPWFDNHYADFAVWHAGVMEEAKVFAQKPGAVILLDKASPDISNDPETLTACREMVANGAHVVVCGFRFPDLITPQTSLMAFRCVDGGASIFPLGERQGMQPGDGILRVPGRADVRVKISPMD